MPCPSPNQLAQHLKWTRALGDIVALRGQMRLGAAEHDRQLVRPAARYGFEPAASLTSNPALAR
jgi:hypothetical protein